MHFSTLHAKNMEIDWGQIAEISPSEAISSKKLRYQGSKPEPKVSKGDRSLGKFFFETICLTLIMAGLWYCGLFLAESPHLSIVNVRFDGGKKLKDAELLKRVGSIVGKNILMADLSDMAKRLVDHPWIREVSAERKLPDSIQFRVIERTAMARIVLDRIYLMDDYGILLSEASKEFSHLPLISGIQGVEAILGREVIYDGLASSLQMMHYLNRLPFFESDPIKVIDIFKNNHAIFLTEERQIRVQANLNELEENFEKLKIVLSLSGESPKEGQTIDLSFKNQVVVKPASKNEKKGLLGL